MIYLLVATILIFNNSLHSQELPQEFFEYRLQKHYFDIGDNWEFNSTLDPVSYNIFNSSDIGDSLSIQYQIGTNALFNNKKGLDNSFYFWGRTELSNNIYIYLYPRIVSDPRAYERFSGLPRPSKRFGFNSGETDLAGLVYENDRITLQIGRGRQIWGAGNNLQIGLGEKSPPYDFGLIKLFINNFQYRFFNGFLENKNNYNRYINGRAIEWSNKNTFVISLSEIVIYSGLNRPFDLAYLNPISTHLEIELNDRQNQLGTDSGNAIWQLSSDVLFNKKNLRISTNFLIDELIIDKIQKDLGKSNGLAWSMGLCWTPIKNNQRILSISGSWIYVGTHTFRHESGYNNFINRNMPLGWEGGSDSEEIIIAVNLFRPNNFMFNLKIGEKNIGQNTILEKPYEPYENYNDGPFPSGETYRNTFLLANAFYKLNDYFTIRMEASHSFTDKEASFFNFMINYYFFGNLTLK